MPVCYVQQRCLDNYQGDHHGRRVIQRIHTQPIHTTSRPSVARRKRQTSWRVSPISHTAEGSVPAALVARLGGRRPLIRRPGVDLRPVLVLGRTAQAHATLGRAVHLAAHHAPRFLPRTTPSQSAFIDRYTHSDMSRSACTTSVGRRQCGVEMRVRGASGSNCARLRRLSRRLSNELLPARVIVHLVQSRTSQAISAIYHSTPGLYKRRGLSVNGSG